MIKFLTMQTIPFLLYIFGKFVNIPTKTFTKLKFYFSNYRNYFYFWISGGIIFFCLYLPYTFMVVWEAKISHPIRIACVSLNYCYLGYCLLVMGSQSDKIICSVRQFYEVSFPKEGLTQLKSILHISRVWFQHCFWRNYNTFKFNINKFNISFQNN